MLTICLILEKFQTFEERQKIKEEIRPINDSLNRVNEPDVIYGTFIERCRNNLHLILCMSPVGDSLRVRCRKFPSLVDCCTLDWFSQWPESALLEVAEKLLAENPHLPQELQKSLAIMAKDVHLQSKSTAVVFEQELKRKVFTTPKSFLDLVELFELRLNEHRSEVKIVANRLSNGLEKLDEAGKQVVKLQAKCREMQPKLESQREKVQKAHMEVEKDSLIAQEQELVVDKEAFEVSKQTQEIRIISDEAQNELDQVMPEMIRAQEAVENIDRNSLNMMRGYAAPPPIVDIVMEGVFILLNIKYEWAKAKSELFDVNKFINKLLNFEKDKISDVTLQKLKRHIANPEFDPEEVGKRVSAAKDLCNWCLAMNQYSVVSKKVAPKKAKADALQEKLNIATEFLMKKKGELDKVKANVQALLTTKEVMENKLKELENDLEITSQRLERAEKLTYLLAEEKVRWTKSIEDLEVTLTNLFGDVFLSSALISYCGPFTLTFRQDLTRKWIKNLYDLKIPLSEGFAVEKIMADPLEVREWMLNGLPSDITSQESAVFAKRGNRWPLLIDPQLQANKWLKNFEKKNKLRVLRFSDTHFTNDLKGAIQFGFPVLIQDVGEGNLDPILDSILLRQQYML